MSDNGLRQLPLSELAARIERREVSPVAAVEASLRAIEELNPTLNAFRLVLAEQAFDAARAAEGEIVAGHYRGPLHGVPVAVKDLMDLRGTTTPAGSIVLADEVAAEDSEVVRLLRAAGAIIVGKTHMPEFAYSPASNNHHYGPVRNPWNLERDTGGSSSGSGAAVAAGLVPFAIGTETHGSITGPSAMCGVSGLRPGFGLVSRRGAMALSWTLDKIGPLCHGADDCGLVLEAIAGPDAGDPATLPMPFRDGPAQPPAGRWRLCLLAGEAESDQPAVGENFRAALEVLRPVADFTERALPPNPYHETVMTILLAEAASAFAHLTETGQAAALTAPETRATPYALQSIPAAAYVTALRIRRRLHRELAAWLAPFDAVVTPTLKKVAPPLDVPFSDYFGAHRRLAITSLGNLLGWPCVVLPTGFGERGLPTSMQFVGRPGSERALLALARHYQQHTDWHTRRPPGV